MRLALISQEYPPETGNGGLGTQTYLKAHGLAELGHEVFVISRSADGHQHEYRDGTVHVTRIPGGVSSFPLYAEARDWLAASREVSVAIQARHAATPLDLVDFPSWGAQGFVHLSNQTPMTRVPAVVQLHAALACFAREPHRPATQSASHRTSAMLEATCLRLADALYSSSRLCAAIVRDTYHLRTDIPVIHAGVDTVLFSPAGGAPPVRPTIVFAGELVYKNGVFQLVEAALELAREIPQLHLRLLGHAGESIALELKRRAWAAGRPALLDIPGFVPHERLPAHLTRAHVLAVPSARESGPGLEHLEAMACGLPVIACSGSGAEEIVTHEHNGLLVPPGDQTALVSALRRVLVDSEWRTALGVRARRYAVAEADSRICIARLEQFYESVMLSHHHSSVRTSAA